MAKSDNDLVTVSEAMELFALGRSTIFRAAEEIYGPIWPAK